jgi:hypothetical protein
MKNFIKTLTIAITVMLFTSCASILDSAKSVNTSALRIGMTKEEVQAALQKKPYATVAARNYPETKTTIEVLQYSESNGQGNLQNYWLYFVNNKLDRWEPANKYGPVL